jgi:hypothetical protein
LQCAEAGRPVEKAVDDGGCSRIQRGLSWPGVEILCALGHKNEEMFHVEHFLWFELLGSMFEGRKLTIVPRGTIWLAAARNQDDAIGRFGKENGTQGELAGK